MNIIKEIPKSNWSKEEKSNEEIKKIYTIEIPGYDSKMEKKLEKCWDELSKDFKK